MTYKVSGHFNRLHLHWITVSDALYVHLQDVGQSGPQDLVDMLPIVVHDIDAAFVALGSEGADQVATEEEGDAIVALLHILIN